MTSSQISGLIFLKVLSAVIPALLIRISISFINLAALATLERLETSSGKAWISVLGNFFSILQLYFLN